MTLQSWYNRCALTMVGLAIMAYAAASRSPEFAVLAVPAVAALWKLSSRKAGRFLLPRFVVNILLLAVLGYAVLRSQGELNVVETVAQVVVLIQIIKTGDRRTPRDDAQILCLAVFLAIAAMLDSNDVWTGVLLVVFLPVLILTVMLFQLYQGAFHADAARADEVPVAAEGPVAGLRRRLRMTTAFATVGAVALGLVVFVLLPRGMGENAFGNFGVPQQRRETGFNSSVTLGAQGIISTSQSVVLNMVVKDHVGQNIGSPDTVHYLRGAVLSEYENRKWTARSGAGAWQEGEPGTERLKLLPPFDGPAIEQQISMRSSPGQDRRMHLFALWRPFEFQFGRTAGHRYNKDSYVLQRSKADAGPFEYTVWSVVYEPPRQTVGPREPVHFDSPPLHALASKILSDAGIDPDPATREREDDSKASRAIQEYLRNHYGYTLEQESPPRDVDPVEHFLFERKKGHCEYFASAMVLLCRSAGINARMVTGYLATEYWPTSGAYVVRESNAHAWVEAEDGGERWRRFDPTPPEDLARIHKPALGLLGRLRNALDAVEYAWNSSIVAFNEQTRQGILGPTRGERTSWLGQIERVSMRVRSAGGSRLMLEAFLNGVVVFAAVASGGFILMVVIRLFPPLTSRSRGRRARGGARVEPAFYRAMLRALARRGVGKPSWRPPLAHAEALASVDAPLAADVERVARVYYAERYNGQDPEATSRAEVRGIVRRLKRRRPGRP